MRDLFKYEVAHVTGGVAPIVVTGRSWSNHFGGIPRHNGSAPMSADVFFAQNNSIPSGDEIPGLQIQNNIDEYTVTVTVVGQGYFDTDESGTMNNGELLLSPGHPPVTIAIDDYEALSALATFTMVAAA